MSDDQLSEALKEIRKITSVILTTALLAVVTTDAVRSALLRRDRAKHLASWLLLKETFRDKAQLLDEAPKAGPIDGFTETIQIQSGTEVEAIRPTTLQIPFILQIPWPGETTRTISIERIKPESPAFRIRSPNELLPFDHYAIASIHKEVWILPIRYTQTVRATYDAILRDKLAAPLGWAAVQADLNVLGWGGQTPDDLRLNDPVVAKFMREGFTASYSISGIPISPGYYPAAISLFLGLQAFVLLGPWLVIRNRNIPSQDSSWIMLVCTPESAGRWLRVARVTVSAICVSLPLLALAIQFRLAPYLTHIERAAWLSTVLGPTAAALLLTAVAKRLIFNTTDSTSPNHAMRTTASAGPASDKPMTNKSKFVSDQTLLAVLALAVAALVQISTGSGPFTLWNVMTGSILVFILAGYHTTSRLPLFELLALAATWGLTLIITFGFFLQFIPNLPKQSNKELDERFVFACWLCVSLVSALLLSRRQNTRRGHFDKTDHLDDD